MVSRALVITGLEEAEVEQLLAPLKIRFHDCRARLSTAAGVVRLELDEGGGAPHLDALVDAVAGQLGDHLVGIDVDGLAEVVLAMLKQLGTCLATAESCTGGLVSAWLTEVPGASTTFFGGVVTYTNHAKEELVAVPAALLKEHGAVSEPVARAMASGARWCFDTDWGIGITGIAGPTGGSAEKPVGLVHWAVAGPPGIWARHQVFRGDRRQVRRSSANAALDLLRRRLLEVLRHQPPPAGH